MPAARGVKRAASKASASTASAGPKNKKKRNVIQLEVPTLPKVRGFVATCGQGDVGQLGLGEDVMETSKFKKVTALGEKIVDVVAGGMHTVALDSDGNVWTFGCNDEGALGRPTSGEADEGTPKKVTLPLPAVRISAGDSHTAALLNNGDVYAWGSFRDSHGSMGLVASGREGKACKTPIHVPLPAPAAALASGSDHLALLTTDGGVYTMGCGEQGQLGRLAQRSATRDTRAGFTALLTPAKVTLKAQATAVWAGYHATFLLDGAKEKLYACGLNNYSQLGITGEKRKTTLYSATECDAFTSTGVSWQCVSAGQHHSLALDTAGRLYAVGRPEYGRLGLGERTTDAETLEPIPKLQNKKVVSIAAGTSNSFAVTQTGEIFAWGMGSEGQLGTGGRADAAEPTPAAAPSAGLRAARVSAGGQHAALLLEDPNAKRSPSPAPEKETEEEKVEEDKEDEPEPVPEKKAKGRTTKRSKKHEQEDEVSSTSSAAPAAAHTKVNGDEKKHTPMEVDETDSKQEKTEEKKEEPKMDVTTDKPDADNSSQDSTESSQDADVEMKDASEPPKPENSDTKAENSDTKAEIPETKAEIPETKAEIPETKAEIPATKAENSETVPEKAGANAEISENKTEVLVKEAESKTELNGTPEETKVEQKTVESISTEQPLATTA